MPDHYTIAEIASEGIMPFGKRTAEPSSSSVNHAYMPADIDPDGVKRVIPKAMWDGPHGAMLRQHGLQPDDVANLALTPQRMHAMADAATDRMKRIVAKANAHLPGISFVPWAMMPWNVWQNTNAAFLMNADFMPSSPWNNMLLAADAHTSATLGLPQHPRATPPGIEENVSRLITELREDVQTKFDHIMTTILRGDLSVLGDYEKIKNDRFQKLIVLTRHVASMVFGEATLKRHDELFGIGLAKVPE
jgi:hypothetical protein